MGLITGFIEGLIKYDAAGVSKALPFQDKIEGANFKYMSESLLVETFGQDGMKGASEACPYRHECSIEFNSKNLAWSFLQAATNTIARASTVPSQITYSQVLTADTITAGTSTLTVDWTPVAGTDIIVSDINGIQYDVTLDSGSLEIEGVTAGLKVTITYTEAPSGSNNEIALGSGAKLGEIGVYGRFNGCPDTLLVQVNRAIIDANLEFAVGTDAASATLVAKALRDPAGNFATIKRL